MMTGSASQKATTDLEPEAIQPLQPVFIVGAQRSGTTMLGSILGSHPDILCLPEGQFIADLAPADTGPPCSPAAIIDRIEKHWRFKVWELELAGDRPGSDTPHTYRAAVEWLTQKYGEAIGKPDCGFWIDHHPGQIGCLAKLLKVFPNAKVIHIVRDVRAVAASILPLDWGPNNAYGVGQFWIQRIASGMSARAFLPPTQYTWLRYEDIVRYPDQKTRRLCHFLGLPYNEQISGNEGLRVPGFTRHQHQLVGKPPDPARIDDWRNKLTEQQVRTLEYVTGDLLPYLGYEKSYPEGYVVSERMKTYYFVENQFLKYLNRFRFNRRRKTVEKTFAAKTGS